MGQAHVTWKEISLVSLTQSKRASGAWAKLLTCLGALAISLSIRAADVLPVPAA